MTIYTGAEISERLEEIMKFMDLINEMRKLQKEYSKTGSKDVLKRAEKTEVKVDLFLTIYYGKE
jgi:hypothetical protein